MKTTPIYISTCDKTKQVLRPAILLLEKYWNFEKQVKIVGYNGLDIDLPKGYIFLSIKEAQQAINDWATDLFSVIKNEQSEHIIFMLDDMLQLDYFNMDVFNVLIEKCRNDKNIVRCCLGYDLQSMPCKEIAKFRKSVLVEKLYNASYRNTTQPSIWRTDYLLSILKESTNPWDFETKHQKQDGKRMLGIRGASPCTSLIETALSANHPEKFNILGLKMQDVQWLVNKGILNPLELQFGIKPGMIPQFVDYYYSFSLEVLQEPKYQSPQVKENLFTYYKARYGKIYNQ
jgi:hypothetical protein